MKLLLSVALLLFCLAVSVRAQSDADDRYIGIYNLIQRGVQLEESGSKDEAFAALTDAQIQLLQFQKRYPDWNPGIVTFRLNQITSHMAELKGQVSVQKAVAKPAQTSAAPVTVKEPATSAELDELSAQVQAERTANEQLQAKLKEALSVRPAAVDPAELERAREKIRSLMKQNDLLMATRANAVVQPVQTVYVTNFIRTVVTNNVPIVVTNLADAFKKTPETIFVTNIIRTVVVDTNALEMLRLERAAAVKNFNAEHARAEQLADELKRLQQLSKPATIAPADADSAAALAALRAENAALKSELEKLRVVPDGPAAGDTNLLAELNQARAQIAVLQAEAQVVALEKLALQQKLQTVLAATNAPALAATAALEARIRELTLERNDLIEKLDAANRQNSGKGSETATRLADLNREVTLLRSRLEALEAQAVPYTPEELALFQKSPTAPSAAAAGGMKSIKELPAGTAELVVSAQRHYGRNEFSQAEADYQKILERDQNNGIALANLAMIEMQQDRLDDAEQHLKAALAQSPDDAYNLSTLGYLKFRQKKYDEALPSLSRAAQLEPRNPEIQNFLGLVLSRVGQRKAAEAALRRAVEIEPKYGPAHENLAAIYLTQDPAAPALARWHYQKALEAGSPRNPELEKMLAEKGAPVQ